MKKLFLIFAALCCTVMANAQTTQPNDEIWYTSTDGKEVYPKEGVFSTDIVSNTYIAGKGIIKFKDDITEIGEEAFYDCEKLTFISIPESVTTLGSKAFGECLNLTTVYVFQPNPQNYSSDAFVEKLPVPGNVTIHVPASSVKAYSSLYPKCDVVSFPLSYEKEHAVTAINTAMEANAKDLTSKDKEELQKYIGIINGANDYNTVETALNGAIAYISKAIETYKEYLGSMFTKQDGPAVEITGPDGRVITLYSPKSVRYIKVKE